MNEILMTAASKELDAYVTTVKRTIDDGLSVKATVERIVAANQDLLDSGFRMPEPLRQRDPVAPYTRNLVYQDPSNRFAIISIVWGAFQETAIHDHLNWCVMSVMEETCLAVDYDRLDDGSDPTHVDLAIRRATVHRPGDICALLPPPNKNIHKIASASQKTAITLHTYGDPGTKARVFDAAAGSVSIRDLVFHNLR